MVSDNNKRSSFADRFKKRTGSESKGSGMAERFAKKRTETEKKASMAVQYKRRKSMATAESMTKKGKSSKKSSKADLVYLVKGIDEGKNAWYYVLVDRLKLSLFLKALNDDIIHLEEYGIILYSAYGDDPPQEITDKLKEEYGID